MKKIKCWECGKEATKARGFRNPFEPCKDSQMSYKIVNRFQRCYCEECFEKHNNKIAEENELWLRLKRERMFEVAIDKLERQGTIDFEEYEEAIKTVEEYNINNPDKFDSSSEIIAAIILIQNHVKIKPQYKIDKYQVDFLLPEEKIVLEIDGVQHRLHRAKDAIRDEVIKYALGKEWQIIRIPAEELEKNSKKLIDAMDAILDRRYNKAKAWEIH